MEHPDFVGVEGTPSGVCWQILSGDAAVKELGETYTSGAAFELFFEDLQISVFDRCVFDGIVWEVRSIQRWSNHRRVTLSEVKHG